MLQLDICIPMHGTGCPLATRQNCGAQSLNLNGAEARQFLQRWQSVSPGSIGIEKP